MFGLSARAFALADLPVGNIERLPRYVRTGLFDAVLVRPLGALPPAAADGLAAAPVARAVFGLAVLGVALRLGRRSTGPRRRVALVVTAPLAGVVFFSVGLRGHRHRRRSAGSTRASSPTGSPTAGGTSPRTRSPSTRAVPARCSRTRWASPSSLLPGAGAARPRRPARPAGLGRLDRAGGRAGRRGAWPRPAWRVGSATTGVRGHER